MPAQSRQGGDVFRGLHLEAWEVQEAEARPCYPMVVAVVLRMDVGTFLEGAVA